MFPTKQTLAWLAAVIGCALSVGCAPLRSGSDSGGSEMAFRQAVLDEQMARLNEDDRAIPASSLAHYYFLRGELALHAEVPKRDLGESIHTGILAPGHLEQLGHSTLQIPESSKVFCST